MTSQAWSVRSKISSNITDVTRYADQGFSSISLNKSHSIVNEYGPLQNYIISKLLIIRKSVLLFPKYSSNWRCGSQVLKWVNQLELLEFQLKNKKVFHVHTVQGMHILFSYKYDYSIRFNFLSIRTIPSLILKRNTRYGSQDDFSDKALYRKTD